LLSDLFQIHYPVVLWENPKTSQAKLQVQSLKYLLAAGKAPELVDDIEQLALFSSSQHASEEECCRSNSSSIWAREEQLEDGFRGTSKRGQKFPIQPSW
jgi:hypothetical protein